MNLLVIGLVCSSWTACDRGKQSQSVSSSAPTTNTVQGERAPAGGTDNRLAWNRKTLLDAYRSAGKRNPAWDAEAEKALDAFAKIRASNGARGADDFRDVRDSARAAVAAGCNDPMIAYLHVRFVPNAVDPDPI